MNRNKLLVIFIVVFLVGGALLWYTQAYRPAQPNSSTSINTSTHSTSNNSVTTANAAIDKVMSLPDIKEWVNHFTVSGRVSPRTGGKPAFTIFSETKEAYVVKAYEDMSDHTATFGFYTVDKATGTVTKEEDSN